MDDHWREPDCQAPLTGVQAADVVRRRIGHGRLETWFEHGRGRLLAVVSNGTRALVMLLDDPGDPGEHAIDSIGTGQQDGFVLSNGQHDSYSDRDTVPLGQALAIVEHIVDHGHPPASVGWQVDR